MYISEMKLFTMNDRQTEAWNEQFKSCGIKRCSSSNLLLTKFYLIGHIIGTGSLPSGDKPTSYIS